jgi:hypothetical protein
MMENMRRLLTLLAAYATATALLSTPGLAATSWDCKRVITPAQWRSVLGTSITVQYGENDHDCNWFHRRPGIRPNGGIEGYPVAERRWRTKYKDDRARTRRFDPCTQVESTRLRLHSFGGDFAWESEYRWYRVPDSNDGSCPSSKTLTAISRSINVVHHGRFLEIYTGEGRTDKITVGATFPQLESLAHKAVRRF